ncbi:hypothetical protein GCM10009682_51440 [Luedemannella flava]|uniref:PH domain-containing protein n=1 Tax=Luedemannella flava TaxID=349316 RepID=A0ABP4YNC5_9ACTN
MAETQTVDRADWASALERLTARHAGDEVTIELLDETYGDLNKAAHMPLSSVMYDPRDDTVVIGVGGTSSRYPVTLRHFVAHPTGIDIYESHAGAALRVTAEDASTIVTFYHR